MAKSQTMGTTLTLIKKGNEAQNMVLRGLTSISALEAEREEIDATTLDSPNGSKEYISGAVDWGEQTIEGYVDDPAQLTKLRSLFDSGEVRSWEFVTPSKNKLNYDGFVKNFSYTEATTDGLESFSLTLKISGSVVGSRAA